MIRRETCSVNSQNGVFLRDIRSRRRYFLAPMNKTLVILAAGIGSRYGGFKQMDPIGPSGEFIIDYSVYDAIRAGFDNVVFLISRVIEADFKTTVGRRVSRRVAVDYAFQEPDPRLVLRSGALAGAAFSAERKKPWGTGHALLSCRDRIRGEPIAVINADDCYGADSYAALARFLDATADDASRHAMVGFVLRNTISEHGHVARGVCDAGARGRLQTIVERARIEPGPPGIRFLGEDGQWRPLTGNELVSMNFWGFKPDVFPHLESQFEEFLNVSGHDTKAEFFIPTAINNLIAAGTITVEMLKTSGSWIGVTYLRDKELVMRRIRGLIASGVYPPNLWEA
ncbi:MAG: sugar phosphate nucleotidyltransferase [Verrucomicrobiota bacterium]|nr:sugar phosphate nucleotidyltransferase [Verrucomicrobiota bacterium]